jgi:hypothetical protein
MLKIEPKHIKKTIYLDKARNCNDISLHAKISFSSACKSKVIGEFSSITWGGLPKRSKINGNFAACSFAYDAREIVRPLKEKNVAFPKDYNSNVPQLHTQFDPVQEPIPDKDLY